MKTYQTFIFDSYSFDPETGRVELRYHLDDEMKFIETLQLPPNEKRATHSTSSGQASNEELSAALFALHLIGGISYYKTCLPKKIEIRSGKLTEDQAAFWNSVYENGLGEFFYKNKIDFRDLIHFPSQASNPSEPATGRAGQKPATSNSPEDQKIKEKSEKRYLVPIGGGKDSMVTVELLKKAGADITLLRMGHHAIIEVLARVADLPLLTIDRRLDPLLFSLNTQGALNGHVPISAYLSCVSILTAILGGFDGVVMSNERSASEGNVTLFEKEINHQWSKSMEFEKSFGDYVQAHIDSNLEYFSLLRPLSELHIAKIFSKYPHYFEKTTSCNANWKILGEQSKERWCGKCPKCAFVFTLMTAFVQNDETERIFGKNLYGDAALLPLYRELLGLEGIKPFECVGTPEETKAAMILAHRRGDMNDTPVMQMFLKDVLPKIDDPDQLIEEVLTPASDHRIPHALLSILS